MLLSLVLAVIGILCLLAISTEYWSFVSIAALIGIVYVGVTWGSAILAFVTANIIYILLGAVIFFMIGGLWSVFRWWRYVVNIRDAFIVFRDEQLENNPSYTQADLVSKFVSYGPTDITSFPPRASANQSKICMWILLWPFSVVHWIFADLMSSVVKYIAQSLTSVYARITKAVFGSLMD